VEFDEQTEESSSRREERDCVFDWLDFKKIRKMEKS